MIGLILWAILIIVIAECACPGFLMFLFCVALPIGVAVLLLASWVKDKLSK